MESDRKNNSASRVRWILLNASHHRDDLKTIDVWKEVLSDGDAENVESFEVIRLVQLLRTEIELAERQLAKAGVREDTYKPHFNKAYKATALEHINAQWKTFKQHIKPEILVALAFAEHIIGDDEPEFDSEEIAQIERLLSDLKNSIESSDLDIELSHFAQQQVSLIERGLHDLRIRGSKALQKCYVEGLGEIIEHADTIRENSDTEVVGKLKTVWSRLQAATQKAATLNRTTDTWARLVEKGNNMIEHLSKLS